MAGSFKGLTQKQIDQRIKQGRGRGTLASYKPFIYTSDVSSLGRSHRIFGHKCQRMHHFLSDLELAVFLMLDWAPAVTDIREQFPLITDDTKRIAEQLGIPHGKFKGVPQVLTADFLVDLNNDDGPQIALQAKYSADLASPETIERMAIEHVYWREKDISWAIVTEKEVPKAAFENIQWMYNAQHEDLSPQQLAHYCQLFSREFEDRPDRCVIEAAQALNLAYELSAGEALYWLRNLLARRYFLFNIAQPYRKLMPEMLTYNQDVQIRFEAECASS